MRTKQLLTLASLALLLLLAAATGCTDYDPTTTAANGLPVDFSSIRIAASANGTGGSTSNVPTTDLDDFYPGDVIHARLTHDGKTQDAWLTFGTAPDGRLFWKASNPIYWQSTDPNTGQTLTLSRGEEGDFTLPDDMEELASTSTSFGIPNYTRHDRLFHSYRGPMPATPITWELQHCMAQIVVTLTRADGSTLPTNDDLNYARVSMTLPAEGHFDGVRGEVSRRNTGAGGGTADTKPVEFYRSYAPQSGVYNHFALALPGSTDTRIITITIPAEFSSTKAEQTYQYTAPENIDLEAGRSHVFRLSLGTRVSALSITTTDWKAAEQGTGVSEGIGIKGVTPGKLASLLPTAVIDYGHISVSGELNGDDYRALKDFLNRLPSPVSLEIEITGKNYITNNAFVDYNKLGAVVLKGITAIAEEAFARSSLTSITLPEGLTHIGHLAFTGCQGLQCITLPSSVTYLGMYAFSDCTNLASVSLPEGLEDIESYAFSDCKSLQSITLPPKVTTWGDGIFSGSGLTSIALPEGMTKIPHGTFERCKDLQTITLPSTITTVGESAFAYSSLTSITLPEGVTTIGERAFMACTKLLKVAAADAKNISVGKDAFAGTPDTKELFDYSSNYWTEWPGITWQTIHINYRGSGDKLNPDSYIQHINP